LAPWHQKDLMESALAVEGGSEQERERREAELRALQGRSALYHCVSRVVNRDFVLQAEEKEEFVRLMRVFEGFCEVGVLNFCVMSNHFHLLLEVPAAPCCEGRSWTDERVLDQWSKLYPRRKVGKLRGELAHYRSQGNDAAAEALRERLFARMWNLSEYMKSLKQSFTQWFNRKHGRRGTLWEERFKHELVEEGHAARKIGAYIDLNPVRAGIVEDPKDYRWSSYGQAVAGKKEARIGLRKVLFAEHVTRMSEPLAERELASWREVQRRYRLELFADGQCSARDEAKQRRGISKRQVEEVLAAGGQLSEAEMLRCRTRYFLDGLVMGSESFVNEVFGMMRGYFGTKRQSGARRMRGVATELCTIRDLQRQAIVP
jgi:REP element-mobilizing transposase RayT